MGKLNLKRSREFKDSQHVCECDECLKGLHTNAKSLWDEAQAELAEKIFKMFVKSRNIYKDSHSIMTFLFEKIRLIK